MNNGENKIVDELANLEEYKDAENLPFIRFKPPILDGKIIEYSRLGDLISESSAKEILLFRKHSYLDCIQFLRLWDASSDQSKEIAFSMVTADFDGINLISWASQDLNMLEHVSDYLNKMELNTVDD